MDFASVIILSAVLVGLLVLASIIYFAKPTNYNDFNDGVLWGIGMGICLGVIIGAGIFTLYWEKRLIREGMGQYKIKQVDSREVMFELIKPKK